MTTLKRYTGSAWETVGSPNIVNSGPAAVIGYTEVTTAAPAIGTGPTDVPSLSVTVTVPAGRRLRISVEIPHFWYSDGTTTHRVDIYKDGVLFQTLAWLDRVVASESSTVQGHIFDSPSAGTHTYKVSASRTSGAGTVLFHGAASEPQTIVVEDITGSTLPYNAASVPVGQIAYAQATTDQSAIGSTLTDITNLSINIVVPAGRVIRLSTAAIFYGFSTATYVELRIMEGANMVALSQQSSVAGGPEAMEAVVVLSPTAGSHTYRVQAKANSGTMSMGANPQYPAFILAEDITPTPAASTGAPGSTLGYTQVTSNQAGIVGGSSASPTDLTGLSATITVPAGRRLRITGYVYQWNRVAGTVTYVALQVREGSTEIQRFTSSINNTYGGTRVEAIVSPSAGTHTYKLSSYSDGTVDMVAAATTPAFILVEDITGSLWPTGSAVTTGMMASEAWTDYTPSWSSTGTAPVLGNGILRGRYTRIGRLIVGSIFWQAGSTTTFGTGTYSWSLPVVGDTTVSIYNVLGVAKAYNLGSSFNGITRFLAVGGYLHVVYNATWPTGTETSVGPSAPWTWVNGNEMVMNFMYEAAS